MGERAPTEGLRVRAPAKVNLCLEVLGRRPDGYHEIRTVMQAVSLYDELEVRPRPDGLLRLQCDDPDVPADQTNLVMRAARLLEDRWGTQPGADVQLTKRIPVGGGLGGGSADGAVALMALSELWGLAPSGEELTEMAAALGSDAPFFVSGGTALCEGRGERVTPLRCAEPIHHVLVMPPERVSTARVYARVSPRLTEGHAARSVIEALAEGDLARLGRSLHNDLAGPARDENEGLRDVERALAACSAVREAPGHLLSGSGSSFFILTRGRSQAEKVAESVQRDLGVPCAGVHSLPAWHASIRPLTPGR